MKKKTSSKSSKKIKKEYKTIMKEYGFFNENLAPPEWQTHNDSFKKFSLYKETRSGSTSIDSLYTAN